MFRDAVRDPADGLTSSWFPTALPVLLFLVCLTPSMEAQEQDPGRVREDSGLLEVRGITQPYRNLLIKAAGKRNPPWNSRIDRLTVEEGDDIKVGQVLVELEKGAEELEAELRNLIADNKTDLENAREREAALRIAFEEAQEALRRTKSISREDVTRKKMTWMLARAERQALEITKERQRVEAQLADVNVARQTIQSPIEGRVLEIYLREGESCEPGDPLLRVVDTRKGILVSNVEEQVGRTLERGQVVGLRVQTGTSWIEREGTIIFVSPVVDSGSGLMPVKVEFDNSGGLIRPGVYGSILLPRPGP